MSHRQNLKIYAVKRVANFSEEKRDRLKTVIIYKIIYLNEPFLGDLVRQMNPLVLLFNLAQQSWAGFPIKCISNTNLISRNFTQERAIFCVPSTTAEQIYGVLQWRGSSWYKMTFLGWFPSYNGIYVCFVYWFKEPSISSVVYTYLGYFSVGSGRQKLSVAVFKSWVSKYPTFAIYLSIYRSIYLHYSATKIRMFVGGVVKLFHINSIFFSNMFKVSKKHANC